MLQNSLFVSEYFEQSLSSLATYFQSFGVHFFHETKMDVGDSDHVMDIDQSGDHKSVASLPVRHVQLWPLSEYIGIMAEWKFVNSTLMSELQAVECSSLVDYMTYCTPASPSELRLYQIITKENRQVSMVQVC